MSKPEWDQKRLSRLRLRPRRAAKPAGRGAAAKPRTAASGAGRKPR